MSDSFAIDCRIVEETIDPARLRAELADHPDCGGLVTFEGLIRNHNHGQRVRWLDYEVYGALAQREMERIAREATQDFGLTFLRIHHRRGRVYIGEVGVIIQALSHHRDEAFRGCRYAIDELKARLPIWKKEYYHSESSQWVNCSHANTEGHGEPSQKPGRGTATGENVKEGHDGTRHIDP